jgi:Protein of unknown function (DUF2971)
MWIEEYERLLTSPDHPFQAAVDLKRQHFPDLLFKYRAVNGPNLDALRRGYVWLAPASSLNDLYDCATTLAFDAGLEDMFRAQVRTYLAKQPLPRQLAEAQIREIVESESPTTKTMDLMSGGEGGMSPELKAAFQRAIVSVLRAREGPINAAVTALSRSHLKVCSFSADGTASLLWSHYADSNRGYSVAYAPASLPYDDIRARLLCPVFYKDKVFDGSECLTAAARRGPNPLSVRWPIISASVKHRSWEYEREWRLINPDGEPPNGQAVPMPPPHSIYLGASMASPDADEILRLATHTGIPVFRMATGPDSGRLVAVAVLNAGAAAEQAVAADAVAAEKLE